MVQNLPDDWLEAEDVDTIIIPDDNDDSVDASVESIPPWQQVYQDMLDQLQQQQNQRGG